MGLWCVFVGTIRKGCAGEGGWAMGKGRMLLGSM